MKPSQWIWEKYQAILDFERDKLLQQDLPFETLPYEVRERAAFAAILLFLDAVHGELQPAPPEGQELGIEDSIKKRMGL